MLPARRLGWDCEPRRSRLTAFAAGEGAETEEDAVRAVGTALEEVVAKQPKSEQHFKLLGAVYKKLGIKGVHVYVKGKKPEFDAQPFIRDGRTLVPVRAIVAALGAEVKWDEATRTVTVTRADKTVQLQIDSHTATVNGQPVELDVPASITNSRTFVPLRFLSETRRQCHIRRGDEANHGQRIAASTARSASGGQDMNLNSESGRGRLWATPAAHVSRTERALVKPAAGGPADGVQRAGDRLAGP